MEKFKFIKTELMKKMAFAKIKTLDCGLTLVVNSKENPHLFTPHFHLYDGNKEIGEIDVTGKRPDINKNPQRYSQKFKEVREYVDNNRELFTEIYYAKDGTIRKELAKRLP